MTGKIENGLSNIRRYKVNLLNYENNEGKWTITEEQLDKHQKLADILYAYDKMGITPDVAMDIIKNSVQ